MTDKSLKFNFLNLSISLASLVLITFGLKHTQMVFVPLFISYLVYILVKPLTDYLSLKFKIPKKFIGIIVISLILLLGYIFSNLIFASLKQISGDFDVYYKQLDVFLKNQSSRLQDVAPQINMEKLLKGQISSPLGAIFGSISSAINSFTQTLSLSLVSLLFLLLATNPIQIYKDKDSNSEIEQKLKKYIQIKSLASIATGVIISIYLYILGYNFVLFIGLMTFTLNFIPSIGSLISSILLIPVFGVEAQNASDIVLPIIFPAIVQFLIGNIVEPKLMGDAFKMRPLLIIFSLIFWSTIFGAYGLFLGVPLTLLSIHFLKNTSIKEQLYIRDK